MKLRPKDVISYQGRDFIVEGLLAYQMEGPTHPKNLVLARAVDGETVRLIEPLADDLDDRFLLLAEVDDLEIDPPPPAAIEYNGASYVTRLAGTALVEVSGKIPDRVGGTCELWRYRAAGDLYLQVEKWSDRIVVLVGESVHKNMIEVLPGS